MRDPRDEAVRSVIFDWRDAIEAKEKLDSKFVREVLLAMTEGLLALDERVALLSTQEWRGMRECVRLQDELNEQKYKMILLQKAMAALPQTPAPSAFASQRSPMTTGT